MSRTNWRNFVPSDSEIIPLWNIYWGNKTIKNRDAIVVKYIDFTRIICSKYYHKIGYNLNRITSFDDVLQIACCTLIECVQTYKIVNKYKFNAYLSSSIEHALVYELFIKDFGSSKEKWNLKEYISRPKTFSDIDRINMNADDDEDSISFEDSLISHFQEPDVILEKELTVSMMLLYANSLSVEERALIVFRFYCELETQEIGRIFGVDDNCLKARLLRVEKKLKNMIPYDYYPINKNHKKRAENKYKGIYKHSNGKSWQAVIIVNNKKLYLGTYNTEEEAYAVYREAEKNIL
ncbi:MAG: sigma-70 family RNA polymerase sigma factor [Candidatus Nanoarchaeia archaeon]|nr:sigma-70 family RNA polymerase sigma factor [Candidatus Nanoarchaeia archaeon]